MTRQEIEEMRQTHEEILAHWQYPPATESELRDAMARWLGQIKPTA